MTHERYTLLWHPPGGSGHKVFRDTRTDRIAIADFSGDTPDQTDDGVLYPDFDRPVTVSQTRLGTLLYKMPLCKGANRDAFTVTTLATVLEVERHANQRFGAPVL